MIDIKIDFDTKKLERELLKQAEPIVLKQARNQLSDLIRKGLKVEMSHGKLKLTGEDELIKEAQKRLS